MCIRDRYNARNLRKEDVGGEADFASIDVSFISLKLILPPLFFCLRDGGEAVALIKPQFEAGKEQVGKNGVVRSATVHKAVCLSVLTFAQEHGFGVSGLDYSPIKLSLIHIYPNAGLWNVQWNECFEICI